MSNDSRSQRTINNTKHLSTMDYSIGSRENDDSFYMQKSHLGYESDDKLDLFHSNQADDDKGDTCPNRDNTKPLYQRIDMNLLQYKGFYFLFFGAVGSLFPYLAVFYKQLLLSAHQVGILIGLRPFIQMCAAPLWGALADSYNAGRGVLLLAIAAWLVSNFSISLVKPSPHLTATNCNQNLTYLSLPDYSSLPISNWHEQKINSSRMNRVRRSSVTKKNQSKTALGVDKGGDSVDSNLEQLILADEIEEEFDSFEMEGGYPWPMEAVSYEDETNQAEPNDWISFKEDTPLFTVLLVITICGTVISSPAATLADTATLQALGDASYLYGQQRLWGAFGWGLGAFVVGAVVSTIQEQQLCSDPKHVDYMLSFYVYAAMMALAFVTATLFQFEPTDVTDKSYSTSFGEGVRIFIGCQNAAFVLTLLCTGAAMGFIHTFLFWHLHDMGGSQLLFSIVAATQCLSEVFMYFLSGHLILRIGYDNVFYIGLICNVIRLLAYSAISHPAYSIPLEILQGVSSASVWTAAVCYVGLIPGAQITLQALLHGIYWGLGHGGGGILGGVLMTYIGSSATFIVYGVICLLNLGVLLLIKYWSKVLNMLGNYTYVENIPAGTYILMTAKDRSMY